ncbi:conserved Plasmodium protein, unknown function [Plasmodium malariae]|uniref:Uncharacterized protein n=1 Tax=Plasmodium malariae TaxID=5858 RepID=A0A1A8VZG3_PLAMA|nr:conserved Plasmodium protein, unknown function [Plasmodium malariae]
MFFRSCEPVCAIPFDKSLLTPLIISPSYFLEKKNEDIIIRLLRCIYLIPFDDYKTIELHKIFYILHEKNIIVSEKWNDIYCYCINIYIKVLKNEEIERIISYYKFQETIVSILRIVNHYLLRAIVLRKKNDTVSSKRRAIEQGRNTGTTINSNNIIISSSNYYNGRSGNKVISCNNNNGSIISGSFNNNACEQEEDRDLNIITVKLLRICSRNIELRNFMRNNIVAYYFVDILSNEDILFSEMNIYYDIFIERTWCATIENIFKTLMLKNVAKNKKVCLRLLINIADIFSGYFYLFKTSSNMNIFDLCSLEDKHWDKKKIVQYYYLMNDNDRKDYKEQLYIFLKYYMTNLFTLLNIYIDKNIFAGLKKEQEENFFPGVLKYNKLRYEKKIYNLKLKEKQIKEKIATMRGGKKSYSGHHTEEDRKYNNENYNENYIEDDVEDDIRDDQNRHAPSRQLFIQMQEIIKKKRKLFLRLHNNNFKQTFDIFVVENEIGCDLEHMFEIPKIVKKKKTLKNLNNGYYKDKGKGDISALKKQKTDVAGSVMLVESGDSVEIHRGKKNKNNQVHTAHTTNYDDLQNNKRNNMINSISDTESKDNEESSSASTLADEDPNETVLDRVSAELLSFNKETMYEQRSSQFNILLFNKRGIFVNSNKGEINEAYILYSCLRVFYSIIVNNINNENYLKVKEFLLKKNVLKVLINILNQCSFYDCIEWYFLALGLEEYYLIYIPDNFEENITEDKDIKLVIYLEKKYVDITRICMSKINDNFFVFGYINFEKSVSYEAYDIFIGLNKYFRDEIVSCAQYLSGADYETKVDLLQDRIIMNNLKNYMNVQNIIITSFAYQEVKQSDFYKKKNKIKGEKREDVNNMNTYEQSYESDLLSQEENYYYSDTHSATNDEKDQLSSSTQSNNEEFNVFRRNADNNKNKRKLVFFVLSKNHIYIFKLNFKQWIFLSPFIDEEKEDIHLYVESSVDSEGGEKIKKKLFTNDKIYLNNILGITVNITNNENISFARKCAVRNTIKNIYSSNNTEYTNEQVVLSENITTTIETEEGSLRDSDKGSHVRQTGQINRNGQNEMKHRHNQRYLSANKCFLKILHKYNNEDLNKVKFVNNYESIITLKYKVKQSKTKEKKIKMILFDDYTRELWKRSLALSLNIQMASSYAKI